MIELLDIFAAREGIVCFVGAGGKKTTLYRLAEQHRGRVAVTSTVHTPPFRKRLNAHLVVEPEEHLLSAVSEAAKRHSRVGYAQPSDKRARLRGVAPGLIECLHDHAGFDLTLVKADGARLRWIKAPASGEPAVPECAATVVHVVSIRALGKPLSGDIVHRPDRFARLTQAKIGEPISTGHIASLIANAGGGLNHVGAARFIALINMVESREQERLAMLIAERVMDMSDRVDRCVIAAMALDEPQPLVVER